MSRFDIDFFELSFLIEACIPPRPIARTMFFHRVIDEIYYKLSNEERERLYTWIKPQLNMNNEDCKIFEARFNPDNQYKISYTYNKKKGIENCFLYEEKYYTKRNTYIDPSYIKKIEKIENER